MFRDYFKEEFVPSDEVTQERTKAEILIYSEYQSQPPKKNIKQGKQMKISTLKIAAFFIVAVILQVVRLDAAQPNIIYFLIDDAGWNDVGYHGGGVITPNIDQLAAQGAKLEHFYVYYDCSPTRAILMTGRYPIRYGLYGALAQDTTKGVPATEWMIGQSLRDVGYQTAQLGKWHLGDYYPEFLPMSRGFDHEYGCYGGRIDYNTHYSPTGKLDWHRDQVLLTESGYSTTLIGNEAVRLIQNRDKARPIYLYVPFNAVHSPSGAPKQYVDLYPSTFPRLHVAQAMSGIDDAIGHVVNVLQQENMLQNTVIICSSDNGGTSDASCYPLRGYKHTLYDAGFRVPAFVYWQGVVPPGTVIDSVMHGVDWFPTILSLAGANPNVPNPLDGLNIWPTITQGAPSPHADVLLEARGGGNGALIQWPWKIIMGQVPGGELYNLQNDPSETTNVANQYPDTLKNLNTRLKYYASQAVRPLQ